MGGWLEPALAGTNDFSRLLKSTSFSWWSLISDQGRAANLKDLRIGAPVAPLTPFELADDQGSSEGDGRIHPKTRAENVLGDDSSSR